MQGKATVVVVVVVVVAVVAVFQYRKMVLSQTTVLIVFLNHSFNERRTACMETAP